MEKQIVYDKNIDPAGHGKSDVDGKGGTNKTTVKKGLCGNVTSQPECFVEGKNTIVYVDMDENGKKIDFADVAAKYLNNDELAGKVAANNPRVRADEESTSKMVRSDDLVCKAGVAKFEGVNMMPLLEPHRRGKDSKTMESAS